MTAPANLIALSELPATQAMALGRDRKLDALRGLMLVIIALDHLPNPIREFTYESVGFCSAAEGFVFLSGYVAGLVYTGTVLQGGPKALWQRALKRAGRIYLYHTGTFASLWALITSGMLKAEVFTAWVPAFFQTPGLALLLGLALAYQPMLLDILPMYCVFMLLTPVAIQILLPSRERYRATEATGARTVPVRSTSLSREPRNKRRALDRFVAAASRDGSRSGAALLTLSIGVWLCAQFGVRDAAARLFLRGLPYRLGDFDPLAWQLLFVVGLWLGFRRRAGQEQAKTEPTEKRTLFPPLSPVKKRLILLTSAYVTALALFALRQDLLWPGASARLWSYAAKTELGPLRLLNFAAVALLISHKLLWPANAPWVRWLAYLGRHSLQVFSFNILCVYLLRGLLDPWEQRSGWVQAGAAVLCVLILPFPAWLHENRRQLTTKYTNHTKQELM